MTFIIFHNKNCSKSRACIEILNQKKVKFKIREYIKNPLSMREISNIVNNLHDVSYELLRKTQKDLIEEGLIEFIHNSENDKLIEYLYQNQKILQRPIFYNGEKYIICRPPNKVLEFI